MTTSSSPRSPSRMIASSAGYRRSTAVDRHALEVLGFEPLEQRHAAQHQHRLEVAEGPTRVRHVHPFVDGPSRQAPDPRVLIIDQAGERPTGDPAFRLRVVLEQPDERAGQPPIADRVERLDRLGTRLRIVRAQCTGG